MPKVPWRATPFAQRVPKLVITLAHGQGVHPTTLIICFPAQLAFYNKAAAKEVTGREKKGGKSLGFTVGTDQGSFTSAEM